jgi:hypothetical protein
MSTDVRRQIRELASAFDEFLDDLTISEITRGVEQTNRLGDPGTPNATVYDLASQPTSRRFSSTVTAVLVAASLVGALVLTDRGRLGPATSVTSSPSASRALIPGVPAGPVDYATTESSLPLWPEASASDPPAMTTGYGMTVCDSGPGTKILRVDPATGPAHAYSGTLCTFIDLIEPRLEATTTCATASDGFNYARCQRRTNQPNAPVARPLVVTVSSAQKTAIAAFPTATSSQQPEVFTVNLSATIGSERSADFSDDSATVTLTAADGASDVDLPGVCYTFELPGATAAGCVGHSLLATGLAYGAFQNGDGPIEIVGIVPDEVTAIEIDDVTVKPTNNVWHYTATRGVALKITARSSDGRTSATV